jgi:RecA-family ATPase
LIQRGASGFFCGPPKGGKSYFALDLLISMALGVPSLGFNVMRPVRCGLISREDPPALTKWRLGRIFSGKVTSEPQIFEQNFYLNSRQQTNQFYLDDDENVVRTIADIKRHQLEFVVLDVLDRMHSSDENDNREMAKVIAQIVRIEEETGASIGIIHHLSKSNDGNITQRLRGAGAIAGFAQWLIECHIHDEEKKVRQMQFEVKAACPPDPIYWQIDEDKMAGIIRLGRVDYEPHEQLFARKLQRI